jgi:hypothetical protein
MSRCLEPKVFPSISSKLQSFAREYCYFNEDFPLKTKVNCPNKISVGWMDGRGWRQQEIVGRPWLEAARK